MFFVDYFQFQENMKVSIVSVQVLEVLMNQYYETLEVLSPLVSLDFCNQKSMNKEKNFPSLMSSGKLYDKLWATGVIHSIQVLAVKHYYLEKNI